MAVKSAQARETKTCGQCGIREDQGQTFNHCSRCKVVAYCSKACQKQHWRGGHKDTCQAASEREDTVKKAANKTVANDNGPSRASKKKKKHKPSSSGGAAAAEEQNPKQKPYSHRGGPQAAPGEFRVQPGCLVDPVTRGAAELEPGSTYDRLLYPGARSFCWLIHAVFSNPVTDPFVWMEERPDYLPAAAHHFRGVWDRPCARFLGEGPTPSQRTRAKGQLASLTSTGSLWALIIHEWAPTEDGTGSIKSRHRE